MNHQSYVFSLTSQHYIHQWWGGYLILSITATSSYIKNLKEHPKEPTKRIGFVGSHLTFSKKIETYYNQFFEFL
jgi:hypothetical protein